MTDASYEATMAFLSVFIFLAGLTVVGALCLFAYDRAMRAWERRQSRRRKALRALAALAEREAFVDKRGVHR